MDEVSPPAAQIYIAGVQAAGVVYCGKGWAAPPKGKKKG